MVRQVDVTDRPQSAHIELDELRLLAVRTVAVLEQLTEVTTTCQHYLAHLFTCANQPTNQLGYFADSYTSLASDTTPPRATYTTLLNLALRFKLNKTAHLGTGRVATPSIRSTYSHRALLFNRIFQLAPTCTPN